MERMKREGKERKMHTPILYEQAIDRTVFLHSVDTQTW